MRTPSKTQRKQSLLASLVISGAMLVLIWAPQFHVGGPPTLGNSKVLDGLAAHVGRHFVHPILPPQHENITDFHVLNMTRGSYSNAWIPNVFERNSLGASGSLTGHNGRHWGLQWFLRYQLLFVAI